MYVRDGVSHLRVEGEWRDRFEHLKLINVVMLANYVIYSKDVDRQHHFWHFIGKRPVWSK